MKLTSCMILFALPLVLSAQGNSVLIEGMEMSYSWQQDSITITLRAPTHGWLGIGFNDENNIVGSDLLLFHVVKGNTEALDMYVQGFGDPRADVQLNGQHSIRLIEGKEMTHQTAVTFQIAHSSGDRYDFQHQLEKDYWLILAYSTHDDFDHHSRMRKHVRFRFEPN